MEQRESIRLGDFRQLKSEIRGSKNHLLIGIDIAKKKHHAFFGTATGKTLFRRMIFENDRAGFEKLITQTECLKVQHHLEKVVFGMEPTANYHKPLGEYLINQGYQVVLVSGVAVKRNRELLDGRWDKHDTKDAANDADLVSQGKCLFYDFPSIDLRDLRNLLSLKRRLKKQEHGLKVRIRNNLLAYYFPEMDPFYEQCKSVGLSIVKWCLSPAMISGMDYDDFVRLVAGGKRLTVRQKERLEIIWKKAADSIGCEVGQTLDFEAKLMVEDLQQVRESIGAVDEHIKAICIKFPQYPYLLTIPGFGPDVSSKVLGAIGNPLRFKAGKQVLRLAGWDLSANRSGEGSNAAVPKISKKGKASLRYALYQAALIASIRNRHFMTYFTNKLRGREREKGIKTKMRVKLAAKMLVIAWTLMKKQEAFDPSYLNLE